MNNDKIAVILTVFDHEYKFQDNLLIGIANNPLEASGLLMNDIFRVLSDFGHSNGEIVINEYSNYEHDLTILTTGKGMTRCIGITTVFFLIKTMIPKLKEVTNMRNFYKMGFIDGINSILMAYKFQDPSDTITIEKLVEQIEAIKSAKEQQFRSYIPDEEIDKDPKHMGDILKK